MLKTYDDPEFAFRPSAEQKSREIIPRVADNDPFDGGAADRSA